VNLVGQAVLRLAFEAALGNHVRSIMLLGHLLDVAGFRQAIERIPMLDGSFVRMAPEPGFAIARAPSWWHRSARPGAEAIAVRRSWSSRAVWLTRRSAGSAAPDGSGAPSARRSAGQRSIGRKSRMNIHEYQAKEILRRYGVATLRNAVATSPDEAKAVTAQLGGAGPWVVKAQIHAGGRGKGGGVKLVKTADEARDFAAKILGKPLVTHQTGPAGRIVRQVIVEEAARSRASSTSGWCSTGRAAGSR
jgi:hypothetical protein